MGEDESNSSLALKLFTDRLSFPARWKNSPYSFSNRKGVSGNAILNSLLTVRKTYLWFSLVLVPELIEMHAFVSALIFNFFRVPISEFDILY